MFYRDFFIEKIISVSGMVVFRDKDSLEGISFIDFKLTFYLDFFN